VGEALEITTDLLIKQEGLSPKEAIDLYKLLQGIEHDEYNDERRETRRHTPISQFDDNINPLKPQKEPLSLEEQIIINEMGKEFWDIADSVISEQQKKRLVYRIVNGLTYEEIGRLEGVSKQTVNQSIRSALKKVRKTFLEKNKNNF